MPLTVFDIKGVPGARRERIEAAVVAGGRHTTGPHEAWIAADSFNGGFRVLITGPHGFERTVTFAIDDNPALIRGAGGGDDGEVAGRQRTDSWQGEVASDQQSHRSRIPRRPAARLRTSMAT
jgi:hypothetical protein